MPTTPVFRRRLWNYRRKQWLKRGGDRNRRLPRESGLHQHPLDWLFGLSHRDATRTGLDPGCSHRLATANAHRTYRYPVRRLQESDLRRVVGHRNRVWNRPDREIQNSSYQGDVAGPGSHVVNSHASAPGDGVAAKDSATGTLTSTPFTIERAYVNFWIGGGNHPGGPYLNLLIDGKTVRTATGHDSNRMRGESFDVRELAGKVARIEMSTTKQVLGATLASAR